MELSVLKTIHQNFTQELKDAHEGKKTSLGFVKNILPKQTQRQTKDIFQVMSIGGTNFKSAVVKKTTNGFIIIEKGHAVLPLFHDKESLFAFLQKYISDKVNVIALNFAYNIQPHSSDDKLDAILIRSSKEHIFDGLVGKKIGEEFEVYMRDSGHKDVRVFVANDAVCLLLSGLTHHQGEHLAGGIIGTGLNFAVMTDPKTIINVESGSFDKFTQSEEGKIIDETSANPGQQLFEKKMAGGYLHHHVRMKNKNMYDIQDTEAVSHLAQATHELTPIAQNVLKRSAALAACQIAGILSFLKQDITFVMQGSLFWKGYNYQETIQQYIAQLEPQYAARFIHIPDADILGAARLVFPL